MEVLLRALRQLTSKVSNLKQTQKTNASKPKKKGFCGKCEGEGHLQRDYTTAGTGSE